MVFLLGLKEFEYGMGNVADNMNQWKQKDAFLKKCFLPFGSMNKNDYEVELMHLLLLNGYEDKSDHLLSRKLQIPISKVRRLRYEVDLRYPRDNDEIKKAFYNVLKSTTYKEVGDLIQFSIQNKSLREYLSERLELEGSYYDSSFNSNIVRITATDLLLLIADFEQKKELKKNIHEKLKNNSKEFPKEMIEQAVTIVKDAVQTQAGEGLALLVENALNSTIRKISKTITNITKQ